MKIGIPKALYYYYLYDKWRYFFEQLDVEIITFDTDKDVIDQGNLYASSEMCLSLKIFLGHVAKLQDKCDYILIPKIDNYGVEDQMCANFSCLYDLVANTFDVKILTYEIDYRKHKKELAGFIKMGKELGFDKNAVKRAYKNACIKQNKELKRKIIDNTNKLESNKKKILVVSHSYNIHDEYVGKSIIDSLKKFDCEVIYSDLLENTNGLSIYLSKDLYWKYSKENIGAIVLCQEKIDGILFLSSFPCGLDSLVNELVIRKIDKPYLNLIIDDLDAIAGIETRIESFIDIVDQS